MLFQASIHNFFAQLKYETISPNYNLIILQCQLSNLQAAF